MGGFPERTVSEFHSVHEECSNEESALAKYDDAVLSAERIMKEVENNISQGMPSYWGHNSQSRYCTSLILSCIVWFVSHNIMTVIEDLHTHSVLSFILITLQL